MRSLSIVLVIVAVACASDERPRLYFASELPPEGALVEAPPALYDPAIDAPRMVPITADGIRSLQFLGPTIVVDAEGRPKGVNFALYSQRAEKVRLLLFDHQDADQATRTFEMTRTGDVWNVFVEGVGLGQMFGYVAWGPNWVFNDKWFPGSPEGFVSDVDFAGNRFNPNKLLFDPYCKAFTRDHDWSKGSAGTGPFRTQSTYGAAMKCVIVKSKHTWSDAEKTFRENRKDQNWVGHRWNDLILYEVHPKGFTANSASKVLHPGTYRGFGEKADYLKALGITAVELLPPYEKPLDGGYWGYNTLSFFAPELSYSWRRQREEVIDEFKWMVEELHKRGIEVILDVVFNHSGEGGLWREKIYQQSQTAPWNLDPQEIASLFSYRGIDNASYYALPPNNGREYCDYTSVGNTMRCNGTVMRRLIIDSLRYWVRDLHVDGYRFDLAPALGAKDLEWNNCPTSQDKANKSGIWWDPDNSVLREIIDDPVLNAHNTRIIAEPWGGGAYAVGQFPNSNVSTTNGWGEWNAWFRDWARSFVNYDDWGVSKPEGGGNVLPEKDGGNILLGTSRLYEHNGRKPYHAVNFVTIHDGFTMYDLVSYNQKVNDCSPLNPICCTAPLSAFCDESKRSGTDDNRSRNWGDEDTKRQIMRNFFTFMMVSQGTPMLFGGDEWLRTQLGNNNTYTPEADNPYSWHDWGAWEAKDDRARMFDFVSQLTKFRKDHADQLASTAYNSVPVEWRSPTGGQPDWPGRTLAISYPGQLAVLINMTGGNVNFTLPAGRWRRLIDTQAYFDTAAYLNMNALPLRRSQNASLEAPVELPAAEYGVAARSIVVVEPF
ncbi:MAG: glycosyl hydrolase [Myxococcaceae bacterium]|nr:glycosyl hydrolase [Myxococcaceae bacterium]